jgi:osmotically-inducible protein OsmY
MQTTQYRPRAAGFGSGAHGLLLGLAAGVALMFFLDPDSGKRRRAVVQDKSSHYARKAAHQRDVLARRVLNQIRGAIASIRREVEPEETVEDAILLERVRAAMGHVVPDPHGVDIRVRCGTVILKGPANATQIGELMACAQRVRGVRDVENRLSPSD